MDRDEFEKRNFLKAFIPDHIDGWLIIGVIHLLSHMPVTKTKRFNNRCINTKVIEKAYKQGKYIENQNSIVWDNIKYGISTMGKSGCGVMAVANAYTALGYSLSGEELLYLISAFEKKGVVLLGKWGTTLKSVTIYFSSSFYRKRFWKEYELGSACKNDKNHELSGFEVKTIVGDSSKKLDELGEWSDVVVASVFNDKINILKGIHTFTVEKRKNRAGKICFVAHNTALFHDVNKNGIYDEGIDYFIESNEYLTLKEAIDDSTHTKSKFHRAKNIIATGIRLNN